MLFSTHHKIKIDKALYERVAAAAEQAGYSSTEEFITHLLEQGASGLQEDRDRELVEQQLRGLGYIE